MDFLFACMMIHMNNMEWQAMILRNALNSLLTGALIPFAVLPWGLGDILSLSPLGTLAGAPLAICTGLAQPWELLPAQILWNIVLWPLAMRCFAASQERMVSYGG